MNDLVYLYWHGIEKENSFDIFYYSNHDNLEVCMFSQLILKGKIEISKIIQVTR